MREPSTRRDQREIIVPGEMRRQRGGAARPANRSVSTRAIGAGAEIWTSLRTGAAWTARMCIARPGEVAGSLVALGAVVYVSVNALGLQAGRHPAPILPVAGSVPAKAPTSPKPQEQIAAAPMAKAEEAGQRAKAEPRPPAAPPRDGIAEVLRAAGDTTASVTPKVDSSVLKAQRALAKLGYAGIKPDGIMGPGTKAAVEKFEREHKLPVTGELAGRTLRELATKAGLPKG